MQKVDYASTPSQQWYKAHCVVTVALQMQSTHASSDVTALVYITGRELHIQVPTGSPTSQGLWLLQQLSLMQPSLIQPTKEQSRQPHSRYDSRCTQTWIMQFALRAAGLTWAGGALCDDSQRSSLGHRAIRAGAAGRQAVLQAGSLADSFAGRHAGSYFCRQAVWQIVLQAGRQTFFPGRQAIRQACTYRTGRQAGGQAVLQAGMQMQQQRTCVLVQPFKCENLSLWHFPHACSSYDHGV